MKSWGRLLVGEVGHWAKASIETAAEFGDTAATELGGGKPGTKALDGLGYMATDVRKSWNTPKKKKGKVLRPEDLAGNKRWLRD